MISGDIVFIWKSDGGEQSTRGIYAKARIISIPPHEEPYTQDTIDKIYKEAGLYVGFINPVAEKNKEGWPYVVIEYTQNLLQSPLLVKDFERLWPLGPLRILKFFQRTLYDDVTEDQGQTFEEAIKGKEIEVKVESYRAARRLSNAMEKFTVSLPKISFDEAQLQAAKLYLTLNEFIIRLVNLSLRDEKVHEEETDYMEMGEEEKIAYLKNLLKERREIGMDRDSDVKELDDFVKSGDYKRSCQFDLLLKDWIVEKYELVYPTGYMW
jgi:hypothetical protein